MKEIFARVGVVVAFMAVATIVIVDIPNRASEQPAEAHTITSSGCTPLDISCHATKAIEQQKTDKTAPVIEPMCKESEDYNNGYICALATENGAVYATAPSTCPAEETRGLINKMTGFIRCTGDAQAATLAAAQGQIVISWEDSDYNGANAWELWGGV